MAVPYTERPRLRRKPKGRIAEDEHELLAIYELAEYLDVPAIDLAACLGYDVDSPSIQYARLRYNLSYEEAKRCYLRYLAGGPISPPPSGRPAFPSQTSVIVLPPEFQLETVQR